MRQTIKKHCKKHGLVNFRNYDTLRYRCLVCEAERKKKHRTNLKETLVKEAGSKCRLCGYNKFIGALEFHHINPEEKEFGLGSTGWMKGLERTRKEAKKCVLLCSNCHKEVEAGIQTLESLTNR